MRFAIEQVTTQRINHHNQQERKTLISRDCKGPDANEGAWKTELKLELNKIKYEVAETKKKKGVVKPLSKADKFAMASLQPACHTKNFSNDYYLIVTTAYDGCVCCVDLPDARMKMTIVPIVNPELFGAVPMADWNPQFLQKLYPNVCAHE